MLEMSFTVVIIVSPSVQSFPDAVRAKGQSRPLIQIFIHRKFGSDTYSRTGTACVCQLRGFVYTSCGPPGGAITRETTGITAECYFGSPH